MLKSPGTTVPNLFIYLFILFILFLAALGLRCCTQAFLWLRQAGATLRCSARASRGGFSCWEHGLQ